MSPACMQTSLPDGPHHQGLCHLCLDFFFFFNPSPNASGFTFREIKKEYILHNYGDLAYSGLVMECSQMASERPAGQLLLAGQI